jgi:hypothetical protein
VARATLSKSQLRVIERERRGKTWRVSDWDIKKSADPGSEQGASAFDRDGSSPPEGLSSGGDKGAAVDASAGRQRSKSFTAKSVAVISAAFTHLKRSASFSRPWSVNAVDTVVATANHAPAATESASPAAAGATTTTTTTTTPPPPPPPPPSSPPFAAAAAAPPTPRRRRGFSFTGVSFASVRRGRSQGSDDDGVANKLPVEVRRRWSSFSGETGGSMYDGSSYDDEADEADTRHRDAAYVWQLAPEHERPHLVELRRQELLDLDLAADAALSTEWMHVLRYRAERTFAASRESWQRVGTKPVTTLDSVARVDTSALNVTSPAQDDKSAQQGDRVAVLVVRIGASCATPTAGEASNAVLWAEADAWLWEAVRPRRRSVASSRPRPGLLKAPPCVSAVGISHLPELPTAALNVAAATRALDYLDLAADLSLNTERTAPCASADGCCEEEPNSKRFGWEGDVVRMERRRAELLDLAIDRSCELQSEWLALLAERSVIAERVAAEQRAAEVF